MKRFWSLAWLALLACCAGKPVADNVEVKRQSATIEGAVREMGTELPITGVTVFFTTFMILGERLADVYPQGRLAAIIKPVYFAFFVDMAVILPFIFWGSILFSHRIAGPMPKIYRTLRSIGDGNFDMTLVLRKHDELKELADVINEMSKNLKEREQKK